MRLLLLFLLVMLVWFLISHRRAVAAAYRGHQQMRDMLRRMQAMDDARRQMDEQMRREQRCRSWRPPKKVYTREEGEYVEFEELTEEEWSSAAPAPKRRGTRSETDSRVSDADWEEL